MNDLQEFNFDGNNVRVITINGDPWWVLKDVCDVLGIDNQRNVAARLEDDEKDVHLVDTLGGKGGHNPPMEVLVRLTNNQITSYLDNLQRRKA